MVAGATPPFLSESQPPGQNILKMPAFPAGESVRTLALNHSETYYHDFRLEPRLPSSRVASRSRSSKFCTLNLELECNLNLNFKLNNNKDRRRAAAAVTVTA
jgi:hypothetical protein